MARNTLIVVLLATLLASPAYAARLYKWVDPQGNVTYQDQPPSEGQGGRVEEKEVRDSRGGSGSDPAAAEAAAKHPVKLYAVQRCPMCDLARSYLKKRNVPFSEVDASEKNPAGQEEMRKSVGELIVPTITVGTKVMKGYVESLLEGELDQAGYPKTPDKAAAGEGQETAPTQ